MDNGAGRARSCPFFPVLGSTMVCISINGVFLDPRHKAYEWQQLVGEDGPPYPEETERRDKPSRFCNFFSVNLRTSNIWGLNF